MAFMDSDIGTYFPSSCELNIFLASMCTVSPMETPFGLKSLSASMASTPRAHRSRRRFLS